jgi:hypothetical protein
VCSAFCSVGDQVRFGQSSRVYLFGGPQELLPEEGISRMQRQQLAAIAVRTLCGETDNR